MLFNFVWNKWGVHGGGEIDIWEAFAVNPVAFVYWTLDPWIAKDDTYHNEMNETSCKIERVSLLYVSFFHLEA